MNSLLSINCSSDENNYIYIMQSWICINSNGISFADVATAAQPNSWPKKGQCRLQCYYGFGETHIWDSKDRKTIYYLSTINEPLWVSICSKMGCEGRLEAPSTIKHNFGSTIILIKRHRFASKTTTSSIACQAFVHSAC